MASCNVDSSPFHSYALEVGWGDKGERLLNFLRIYICIKQKKNLLCKNYIENLKIMIKKASIFKKCKF